MSQKRLLTFQDYSCLGRCSITVALPTISAFGVECVAVPTAILSNHTAGFKSWTYLDLKNELKDIIHKWNGYKHHFDAIYTGYLGTEQVPIIKDIIDELKDDKTIVLVDPAFADFGKMYKGFNEEHIKEMKKLIAKAHIIVPNLTEACFLSDVHYDENMSDEKLEDMMKKLAHLGPKEVIISGLHQKENLVTSIIYDSVSDKFSRYSSILYEGIYHGTGDLFASTFIGAKLNGFSTLEATKIAHDYVAKAIAYTLEDGKPDVCYGVEFERAIPDLIKMINKEKNDE